MDIRIPPLRMKIMLESNPPKSRMFVRRLAASRGESVGRRGHEGAPREDALHGPRAVLLYRNRAQIILLCRGMSKR